MGVNWEAFQNAVSNSVGIKLNSEQEEIVRLPLNCSIQVLAGPGSGKTATLALRILKLIYVDDVSPSKIVATTFTKKAAAELRSRVLDWGIKIGGTLNRKLDLNQIITGTLDSIVQEILTEYRPPASSPPVVIEDFLANMLMTRLLLRCSGDERSRLEEYVVRLEGSKYNLNPGKVASVLREIRERVYHDQVNFDTYCLKKLDEEVGCVLSTVLNKYEDCLNKRFLCDYPMMEKMFLDKLGSELQSFLDNIRYIFIDEYQDTNYLQEQIYLKLAKAAINNGGGITIVGDDDQSLYRFRGATVDLFINFPDRMEKFLGIRPVTKYLSYNYRSTKIIVDFVNEYISLDNSYVTARVSDKPPIKCGRERDLEIPVLGVFQPHRESLAEAIAELIDMLIHKGLSLEHKGKTIVVKTEGSPGDIAVLCYSPKEYNYKGEKRLPALLREKLCDKKIEVFNPRGQNLTKIPCVMQLCGLLLECLDPEGDAYPDGIPEESIRIFEEWRNEAKNYIENHSDPYLKEFVGKWQKREPDVERTTHEVPIIDLIYKLITWIPVMQDDVEGLVYLEAITRAVTQGSLFSRFGGNIIFKKGEHESIKDAYYNIFSPIAVGAIDIEEDLLETIPNDRVSIMSIHQAKGLEFPVIIVDVGSDFRSNHHLQAPQRFPRDGSKEHRLEEDLREFSPLGRPTRSSKDRAFDDLFRRYFVAYSRAQDLLVLAGLNSLSSGKVKHVALGWTRDETWCWKHKIPYSIVPI